MKPMTPPADYGMWRLMAWCGPIFMATFFVMWGVLAGNLPPLGADLDAAQVTAHYLAHGVAIQIGMSVCMVGGAFYMAWGLAVSRVMRRIEGPEGMLSNLEMMGATITCAPIIVACGIWLSAALEAPQLPKEIVHLLYWLGWMIIDLAYMVTSFQIFAVSVVFLRDKREKLLVPSWLCWWGFVTFAAFFPGEPGAVLQDRAVRIPGHVQLLDRLLHLVHLGERRVDLCDQGGERACSRKITSSSPGSQCGSDGGWPAGALVRLSRGLAAQG